MAWKRNCVLVAHHSTQLRSAPEATGNTSARPDPECPEPTDRRRHRPGLIGQITCHKGTFPSRPSGRQIALIHGIVRGGDPHSCRRRNGVGVITAQHQACPGRHREHQGTGSRLPVPDRGTGHDRTHGNRHADDHGSIRTAGARHDGRTHRAGLAAAAANNRHGDPAKSTTLPLPGPGNSKARESAPPTSARCSESPAPRSIDTFYKQRRRVFWWIRVSGYIGTARSAEVS